MFSDSRLAGGILSNYRLLDEMRSENKSLKHTLTECEQERET